MRNFLGTVDTDRVILIEWNDKVNSRYKKLNQLAAKFVDDLPESPEKDLLKKSLGYWGGSYNFDLWECYWEYQEVAELTEG